MKKKLSNMDDNAWAITAEYRKTYIVLYNIPHKIRFTGRKYTHVINTTVILKDTYSDSMRTTLVLLMNHVVFRNKY